MVTDVQFLIGLEVPRAGQDAGLGGPIQHVTLTEERALDAPAHGIA